MKILLSCFAILLITCINFNSPTFIFKEAKSNKVNLSINENDTILKWMNLEEFKNEFYESSFLRKIKSDSVKLDFEFELKCPKIFRFYSLKPQTRPTTIYVEPGDIISYKSSDNNEIVFEGKNAAHYNFFNKLDRLELYYPTFNEKEGLINYKLNVDEIYKKRLNFLLSYEKNEKVSKLFTENIKKILYFEYLNRLLNRLAVNEKIIKENPKYLYNVSIDNFKINNQEDNNYFYLALYNYLHFNSVINNNASSFSIEKLEFQLNFINKNLTGSSKEFAITKTLIEFEKNLKLKNIDILKKIIAQNLVNLREENYRKILEQKKQQLDNYSRQIPKEVLTAQLINLEGERTTLEEILKLKKNKIKVIDFWASWCAPCISEIKKSHSFKENLEKEQLLEFLFFSIDKDEKKWKKRVSELSKYGLHKNQYLIEEDANSTIANYFSLTSIPKYVGLSSENKIFIKELPLPSENEKFKEIVNQIIETK